MKRTNIVSPLPGKKAKKSKLASIFDKLESNNAAFLSTAAEHNNAFQVAQTNAAAAAAARPSHVALGNSNLRSHPLKFSSQGSPMDNEEAARRADRRKRFLAEQQAAASSKSSETLVEARATLGTAAQGQNKNLEKDYLRLTSHPSIADVRSPQVLEQALALVQQKWRDGECSYKYACDQLKSIRQDFTVQHIRNALTIKCYETHARIAIEVGDYAEVRQTLAVLGSLYVELGNIGVSGGSSITSSAKKKKKEKKSDGVKTDDVDKIEVGLKNQSEFMAYNLMLAAATSRSVLSHELKECASRGFLNSLEEESTELPFLRCALTACTAATSSGNFVRLLKLYETAPRMVPYLLDLLVEKTRTKIYSTLLAAYSNNLPLSQVATWLGFAKRKDAITWIRERNGVIVNSEDGGGSKVLDIKASREGLRNYVATNATAAGPSPSSK